MAQYTIIWTSVDGGSTIDISGDYTTTDGSPAGCALARRMAIDRLLGQCPTVRERDWILAGTVVVDDHDPVPAR